MAGDEKPAASKSEGGRSGGGRAKARLIGFVVVLVVLVWFALGNVDRVKVSFLVVHTRVRLIYALAFAAILGALADRFATLLRHRRG